MPLIRSSRETYSPLATAIEEAAIARWLHDAAGEAWFAVHGLRKRPTEIGELPPGHREAYRMVARKLLESPPPELKDRLCRK